MINTLTKLLFVAAHVFCGQKRLHFIQLLLTMKTVVSQM